MALTSLEIPAFSPCVLDIHLWGFSQAFYWLGVLASLSVLSYCGLFLFIKLEEWGTSHLPTDLRQRLLLITSAVPISQCSFTHQSSQCISSKLIQPDILNLWMPLLHNFTVHSLTQTAWWPFILVKPWVALWTPFLLKWIYHISAII